MYEKLADFLDSFLEMGVPGYDCLLQVHGEPVFRRMNGFSDREAGIPMKGNERYHIYSCSKVITCAAALQLFEKGLFKLDDELCRYMPEFERMNVRTEQGIVPAKNRITIRNLFTMTAGFNYNIQADALKRCHAETGGRCPTRELIRYLAQEPLDFEPGARWAYSLCHDVLPALVEVLTGTLFNDYVTKHIFKPLGMKDSTYLMPMDEFETALTPEYIRPWGLTGSDVNRMETTNCYRLGSEYASGGAGCVSTVEDYSRFLEALRVGDVILKKETVRLMAQNQLTDAQYQTFTQPAYGYGLGVRCPREGGVKSDFGWGGAAGAWLAIDPKYDFTVYYAQHVMNSPNQGFRIQIGDLIREELSR